MFNRPIFQDTSQVTTTRYSRNLINLISKFNFILMPIRPTAISRIFLLIVYYANKAAMYIMKSKLKYKNSS